MRLTRNLLQNPYAGLNSDGGLDAYKPPYQRNETPTEIAAFLSQHRESEIESAARKLLKRVWEQHKITAGNGATTVFGLLDPRLIAESNGIRFQVEEELECESPDQRTVLTAGLYDPGARLIRLSRRTPNAHRRFTFAHEIGHATLHTNNQSMIMHRDRPIDGSSEKNRLEKVDIQANEFAGFLLVPTRLLAKEVFDRFGAIPVAFDHEFAVAANPKDPGAVYKIRHDANARARFIATATSFGGKHFNSLAESFGVSPAVVEIQILKIKATEASVGRVSGFTA